MNFVRIGTDRAVWWVLLAMVFVAEGCGRAPVGETPDIDFGQPSRKTTVLPSGEPSRGEESRAARTSEETPSSQRPSHDSPAPPEKEGAAAHGPTAEVAELKAGTEQAARGEHGGPNAAESTAEVDQAQVGSREPAKKPSESKHAAFPGRPAKGTHRSAADAATEASRLLSGARAAERRGDPDAACRRAIDAFAAVAAHVSTDEECRRVAAEAERLIDRVGDRSMPADVPTRFE